MSFFLFIVFFSYIADSWHIPIRMVYYIWLVEEPKAVFPVGRPSIFFCRSDPWSSCSIAVCQSRTFPPRMSLPRQNLLLHLYPLCRDSPVNMQMFCPMAQESSQLHTMKITLLSGVADPDVQRYFSVFCIKFLSGILCLIPVWHFLPTVIYHFLPIIIGKNSFSLQNLSGKTFSSEQFSDLREYFHASF